jgi:hypothetical protein
MAAAPSIALDPGISEAQNPVTSWSSLLTQHAGKLDKAVGSSAAVLDDSFPKRWKLLITVIDCSHTPRLLNPPKSIEALKARLSAAVGIEASKSHHGHPEATAQAIVTGLEGPERRAIDNDEDLLLFWENVKSGAEPSSPACEGRSPKVVRERSINKARQSASDTDNADLSSTLSTSPSRPLQATLTSSFPTTEFGPSELGALEEQDEMELLDFEEREKAMQREIARLEDRRLSDEAKLEEAHRQAEVMQQKREELEIQLASTFEKCKSLQEENLQFIKAFEEQVEQRRAELAAELDKKYQLWSHEQGKILAESQSQVKRLEGQVELRDEKIKDFENQLREQRNAFKELASNFEEEREQFEEERKRLASKVQRVRQLEFFADCWKRKVMELTDVSGRELRDNEDSLQYRIGSISEKIEEFQKGRLVQSPEFEVPELGKVQFEFFPTGDVNSRQGWCSFRLRVPDHTRLRWSAFIGKRRIGPRTDHFDQRQWWCRYGLLWLNFCPISDVRSEISPETDTLLCGIEVHEILPNIDDAGGSTPVEASLPVPRDRVGVSKGGEPHDQSKESARSARHKSLTSLPATSSALSANVEVGFRIGQKDRGTNIFGHFRYIPVGVPRKN